MTTNTSANQDEIAKFSAIAAEWWNPDGPLKGLHRLNPARMQFIRARALSHFDRDGKVRRPFEGLTALDYGCGGGLVCEPLARLGFTVTGVDASEETVSVARLHGDAQGLGITYRDATSAMLAAEGAKFDLVLALEVVEHVDDRAGFLTTLSHVLAPGGLMIVATLNRTAASYALGIVAAERVLGWAPVGAHEHRKFVTPDELRADLSAAGLEVEGPFGLTFDLSNRDFRLSADASINYFMSGRRT